MKGEKHLRNLKCNKRANIQTSLDVQCKHKRTLEYNRILAFQNIKFKPRKLLTISLTMKYVNLTNIISPDFDLKWRISYNVNN